MPAHLVFIVVNVCTFFYFREKFIKCKKGDSDSGEDKHSHGSEIFRNDETEFSSAASCVTTGGVCTTCTRNQDPKENLHNGEVPITFIESGKTSEDSFESIQSEEQQEQRRNKPLAGSTCVRLRDAYVHDDVKVLVDKEGEGKVEGDEPSSKKVAWLPANPSIIHLRGPDYLTTRQKHPSPGSLYTLKQMDVFYSEDHEYITNIGRRFQLPENDLIDEKDGRRHWCAPDTLIISFALPTTAPKLHIGKGSKISESKGLVVCGYYHIKPDVRKALAILSNSSLSLYQKDRNIKKLFPKTKKRGLSKNKNQRCLVNGILLWEKWCSTSDRDPEMQKRLKFIPRGENISDLGVPSWICKYNGKPMLIKRPGETNFIFSHTDTETNHKNNERRRIRSRSSSRVLEININLHPLPYMFKQAMAYLTDHYFSRMNMTFGFVIEGRSVNELPEVLIGDPISLPFNDITKITKSSVIFGCEVPTTCIV